MTRIPEEIVTIIEEGQDFLLLTHTHPDGDALGSLLGMAEILKGMGKEVLCFTEEPVSHLYDFLPESGSLCNDMDEVNTFVNNSSSGVVTVGLDCGEADRLGVHKVTFLNNRPFLVIDHHRSHKKHGDFTWVEPGSSSTGEMVFELANELGAQVSLTAAYNLYVAISTDTGSFRYENTSSRTLEIASDLVRLGVQPEEIASRVYDNFTAPRLKLMEMVLGTLELYEDEQLAFISATRRMYEESGASYQDVEGFIDFPKSLKSVKVAVFIKETKTGMVSVSLRAKGECDVTEIAKKFNGGGHRNAAGCKFPDKTVQEVKEEILPVTTQALYSGV